MLLRVEERQRQAQPVLAGGRRRLLCRPGLGFGERAEHERMRGREERIGFGSRQTACRGNASPKCFHTTYVVFSCVVRNPLVHTVLTESNLG